MVGKLFTQHTINWHLFLLCLTLKTLNFLAAISKSFEPMHSQQCTGITSTAHQGANVSSQLTPELETAMGSNRKATTHSQWWLKVRSAQRKGEGSKALVMRKEVDGWRCNEWNFLQRSGLENGLWVTPKPVSNQWNLVASVQFNEQWLT